MLPARHRYAPAPETFVTQSESTANPGPGRITPPGLFCWRPGNLHVEVVREDVRVKSSVRLFTAAFALLTVGAPTFAESRCRVGVWDGVVAVSNNTVEIPFKFEIVASNGG